MKKPQRRLRFFHARGARCAARHLRRIPPRRSRPSRPNGRSSCVRRYTVTTILPNCSFDSR
ncbi:hypothetical protein CO709_17305 [Burkholderia thailandensis]|nr:hypothetical protein CO709_17305 [Burkholderia thailandensis]